MYICEVQIGILILSLFNAAATSAIYTLSLHDALPISAVGQQLHINGHPFTIVGIMPESFKGTYQALAADFWAPLRSEEHTSELQSRRDLVCRLLLEKKKRRVLALPLCGRSVAAGDVTV